MNKLRDEFIVTNILLMKKHISYGVQGNSCVRPIMLYNIWLKVAGVWHTTNAMIMPIITSVMLFTSLLD